MPLRIGRYWRTVAVGGSYCVGVVVDVGVDVVVGVVADVGVVVDVAVGVVVDGVDGDCSHSGYCYYCML